MFGLEATLLPWQDNRYGLEATLLPWEDNRYKIFGHLQNNPLAIEFA